MGVVAAAPLPCRSLSVRPWPAVGVGAKTISQGVANSDWHRPSPSAARPRQRTIPFPSRISSQPSQVVEHVRSQWTWIVGIGVSGTQLVVTDVFVAVLVCAVATPVQTRASRESPSTESTTGIQASVSKLRSSNALNTRP